MGPHGSAKLTLASLKPPKIRRKQLRKYSWLPDVLRLKGSIIPHIFGPVFTVTIFSVIVAYARSQGKRVELANSVVPLLSVVVGLILVFRNGSSYDRYWEGRKCFSTLTANARNLSRMVWVHAALPPTENGLANPQTRMPNSQFTHAELRCQKIEVLRCCVAFVYGVKHYLRGEDGAAYGDMAGLLPPHFSLHHGPDNNNRSSVPSYAAMQDSTSDASNSDRRSVDATKRVKRKRSKKHTQANASTPGSTTPLLNDSHQTIEFHSFVDHISMPVPLIIAHEISSTIFRFRREGLLETVGPAGTNAMSGLVTSMVDQMTSMERIANTPIPSSYGIHLKQCVTLYLFALPLTLMNELGWGTILIVTVVAFTLMGIEGIADQIEMPFGKHAADITLYAKDKRGPVGYDPQDLPLEVYCDDLKEEVEFMIERLAEGGYGTSTYDDGEGDD